ncbi:DUF1266 domain-containing protein [Streptomyces endophyticus]|uniref:DUF1266 domain-containing protein n=1 Tax=Streptomyces endophyticus TaxID=714166 RepID=A0ABU6F5C7_9ACTN|nr:DUF1266 domain-containing protein [Streptomyces endophyticus]MEB8339194.1 DUF1266 domain-containing protein [Streptomyces endophyticus]
MVFTLIKPRTQRVYRTPLTPHQLWMVSLSAPVRPGKGASRTTLYPFTRVDDDKARRLLAGQWETGTRDELLGRLGTLARSGFRERARARLGVEPLAWDIALYADAARCGFAAGLLSEADAWNLLKNVVPQVARTYNTWQEYADHYLLGLSVWREGAQGTPSESLLAPRDVADAHVKSLLDPANRKSPWRRAPLDVIRRPDLRPE